MVAGGWTSIYDRRRKKRRKERRKERRKDGETKEGRLIEELIVDEWMT